MNLILLLLAATPADTLRVKCGVDSVYTTQTLRVGSDSTVLAGYLKCKPSVPIPPTPLPPASTVELPRVYLDTMVASARAFTPTRTISPATSAALQSALDTARFGDLIQLQSGVTYTRQFHLRAKSGNGWITIQGQCATPPGGRARPSLTSNWPKIVSDVAAGAAIQTDSGAHNYRLSCFEVTAQASFVNGYSMMLLGATDQAQTKVAQMPYALVLDRMYIHGTPSYNFQRCVSLQSASTAIVDSWISECHGKGFDSQAIAGWNGSGPYLIENNYLEGAGENVMFGGAGPSIANQLPSDIVVRRNYIFKPLAWKTSKQWTIKNLFELKLGVRVLVEANILENMWTDAQNGVAVIFNSTNDQQNAPWSETRDVTFRWNLIRNTESGLSAAAAPNPGTVVPMSHLYVGNNWFDKLIGQVSSDRGLAIDHVSYTTIEFNTAFHPRHGLILYGSSAKSVGWNFSDNAIGTSQPNYGSYGAVDGDGGTIGTAALNQHATGWIFLRNVLPSGLTTNERAQYPTGNTYTAPASLGTSGVNQTLLAAATAGVIVPP